MKKQISEEQRILSIFAHTAFKKEKVEKEIEACLSGINLANRRVILSVEESNIKVVGGDFTTLVILIGDSRGGWKSSGMEAIFECLQKSGYMVQCVNAAHSFVPPKIDA